MDYLEISRMEISDTEIIGILLVNKKVFGPVLEPPKKGNETDISCIPTGQYRWEKYHSKKFNRICIKLFDVYGRDYISIHNGNSAFDTLGCILVGLYTGNINGNRAIHRSKYALGKLMDLIGDEGVLTIREAF